MNPARLLPPFLLLCAFLLAACGNKADLFMPPPPEEVDEVEPWDGEDPFAEDVEEEAATAEPVPPVPTATGTEPARTPVPPIDDDDSDPPAEPVNDDE